MQTLFSKLSQKLGAFLTYKENPPAARFVLGEEAEGEDGKQGRNGLLHAQLRQLSALLAYARQMENVLQRAAATLTAGALPNPEALRRETGLLDKQYASLAPLLLAYESSQEDAAAYRIRGTLEEGGPLLESVLRLPQNRDVVKRHFILPLRPPCQALLIYMEGMSDKKLIDQFVLAPLMNPAGRTTPTKDVMTARHLIASVLPAAQAGTLLTYGEVEKAVYSGDAVILIDGLTEGIYIDTKGWEHRSVDKPAIEPSVRGSQSGFTETLTVNTALVRSKLRTADLITEIMTIGKRGHTRCAVMYLQSLANPVLVAEMRRRLEGINTDVVTDVGVLEQFIDDHPYIPFPTMLSTERPDRVPVHLAEGRIAVFLEGSPFAILAPADFFSLFHASDDYSFKMVSGSFMRLLRVFGALLAAILPAFYLAISYFHQEALPTDLALAIAGARERVPFPSLIEVLLMEFSFELIRESGSRIPGILGSTIGIVGAIIIGQAAVQANLVSPIVVIVIALTGLASFSLPDYRMAFGIRIIRFGYLTLAMFSGLVGLAAGLLLTTIILCSMKSLGVPFLAPVAPKTKTGWDTIIRGTVTGQETRPDELNPRDVTRQSRHSKDV